MVRHLDLLPLVDNHRGATAGNRLSLLPSGLIAISVKSRRDDGLGPVASDKRFH